MLSSLVINIPSSGNYCNVLNKAGELRGLINYWIYKNCLRSNADARHISRNISDDFADTSVYKRSNRIDNTLLCSRERILLMILKAWST
jgi:hypothetical protein